MCSLLPALTLLLAAPTPLSKDDGRLKVAFLVWEGMELIESMGPAHVFAFAPGMDEFTVGKTRDPIRSEFVTIVPEYTLDDCPEPDVIVVPGGAMWVPSEDEGYRQWLVRQVPRTKLTLTVCNSAILFAELGLLDGKEATCGDANLDDLMLLGKDVKAYLNRRWVHSGNIVSSKSYLGGLDGAIYAVRVLRGVEGEKRVLAWSNYEGDLSRWDALHAQPGRVPVSRRREVVRILESQGMEAALAFFREWEQSGRPALSEELQRFGERNLFQWMAWGDERRGRFDRALLLTEFKARAWPESATERAYWGEALMKAGRLEESVAVLLEALALDAADEVALGLLAKALAQPGLEESEAVRRGREVLEAARGDG